jgi:hypothetical protein
MYRNISPALSLPQSLDCLVLAGAFDKAGLTSSDQQGGMTNLTAASKKKMRADLYDHFRHQLFTLRYEILRNISSLLSATAKSCVDDSTQTGAERTPAPHTSNTNCLLSYFMSQFYLAVKDGLTVRNFNVCPHSPPHTIHHTPSTTHSVV